MLLFDSLYYSLLVVVYQFSIKGSASPNLPLLFTTAPPPWVVCTHLGIARRPVSSYSDARASLIAPIFVHLCNQAFCSCSKGISSSALPYRRTPPSWLKITAAEVTEHCSKMARKGLTPSQIGVSLRDSAGIAQVKNVTGNKILRLLKSAGTSPFLLQPTFPRARHFHPCALYPTSRK